MEAEQRTSQRDIKTASEILSWFFLMFLIIFLIFAFILNTSVCNLREKQDILSLLLQMFYKIHA